MKLEAKLNAFLKAENEKTRIRSGRFSPSLFGRCYRLQVWNRMNEKPSNPIDERTLRVFMCGNLFHDFVQQFIPNHQKEVTCETDFVKGRADIVTEDSVIDLKSQHSYAFHHMNKTSYDIAKERYANWLQVAFYAIHLKKETCKLVFISKDDLCIKEYALPTDQWTDEVAMEIASLKACGGEIPEGKPRAYGTDKRTGKPNGCEKYCNFRDLCIKTGEGYTG